MSQRPEGESLNPSVGEYQFATANNPFLLEAGEELTSARLAYETYGTLNREKDNAILVFHALSGSQHAAGYRQSVSAQVDRLWTKECKTGWWDKFIGKDAVIDTSKYFVICVNYLGGCYGSTGPDSINSDSGQRYMASFPWISFVDIVRSQMKLVESFEIKSLLAVVGPSLGGLLALTTTMLYPEKVQRVISIASGLKLQPLQIIHNYEQIRAIESDPLFLDGNYTEDDPPRLGLELARMIGHKTYVSLSIMAERARENLMPQDKDGSGYRISHSVESYFNYQAKKFSERFDANSYLRIVNAWQRFKIENKTPDIKRLSPKFKALIISIDTDVCFYPNEQVELYDFLRANEIKSDLHKVHSQKGHDSFLLEPDLYYSIVTDFLES